MAAVSAGKKAGFPSTITPLAVKKYFKTFGKTASQVKASITRAIKRKPFGHIGEVATRQGETLMMDNIDSPFARMEVDVGDSENPRKIMQSTPSIHGYRDAVLIVDEL